MNERVAQAEEQRQQRGQQDDAGLDGRIDAGGVKRME